MRAQRVNRARFTVVIAADNTDIGGVRGSGKQLSIGLAQEGQGRAGWQFLGSGGQGGPG